MELFERAKAVRLRSHHDKFLHAADDEVHVVQDRDGTSPNARWAVEPVQHAPGVLRLRGRYGRYLTASNEPFLLGVTGRKVLQSQPPRLDSSVEWIPVRDGLFARLRTRYGNYLRANAGLPPWRNSVTHDVPHRSSTQDWILWDVQVVQVAAPYKPKPPPPLPGYVPSSPEHQLSRLESTESFSVPLHKVEGRAIHYHIGDENGDVEGDVKGHSFTFNGTSLEELMGRLKEETGLTDIIMCSRSPITGKVMPLRLQLPPNNAAMHVVLVLESSKVAKTFS